MSQNEYQPDDYVIPKMDKFVQLDNSDYDYCNYERTFSGRMTKARYKILDRFCRIRSRSPRYRCGHEHDCCGCLCGQRMELTYSQGQVKIILSHSFNY